jgi:hypothetical protein
MAPSRSLTPARETRGGYQVESVVYVAQAVEVSVPTCYPQSDMVSCEYGITQRDIFAEPSP